MTTILIVDDEDDLRLLLRLSLRGEPYKIVEAATGAEAAERWPGADLILLDLRLPDIDGLDLVRRLRSTKAPVIAMSAYAGGNTRASAIQAGCAGYLTKPFTPTEFINAVHEHLRAAS